MGLYFASEDALIEYLKANLKLVADKEYGYYGEVTYQADVTLNGKQIVSDSTSSYVDPHCSGCKCYE